MFGKAQTNQNRKLILDIGTQYVKIIDLTLNSKDAKLNNYKILNIIQRGKRFIPKEISKIIKKSMLEMKASNMTKVYTSISGKSVIVRFMDMPQMPVKKLKASFKNQTDVRLPFELYDSIYDCQILQPATPDSNGKMKVVIAAAPKKEVEKITEITKGAGLAAIKMDVDVIAIANAYEWGRPANDEGAFSLVNIGSTKTHITIVHNGKPVLSRELNYGGINFTEAISQGLQIEFDEAEALKIKGGDEALSIIEEAINPLSTGIAQSFDFFEGSSGTHIQKIYLSGGGSQLRGLIDSLKTSLNRTVYIWNPLRNVDISSIEDKDLLQSNSPILAVAMGIGLGESDK